VIGEVKASPGASGVVVDGQAWTGSAGWDHFAAN